MIIVNEMIKCKSIKDMRKKEKEREGERERDFKNLKKWNKFVKFWNDVKIE